MGGLFYDPFYDLTDINAVHSSTVLGSKILSSFMRNLHVNQVRQILKYNN